MRAEEPSCALIKVYLASREGLFQEPGTKIALQVIILEELFLLPLTTINKID